MKRPTIAVLFGGCSAEYDVSLQSAYAVLTHIDQSQFEPLPIGITREGRWISYNGSPEHIADGTWAEQPGGIPCVPSPDRTSPAFLLLGGTLRRVPVNGAFPVLHGQNGEDGTVQGLLELAGIPIVGCGTLASALCMDKDRAHKLCAYAGVAVPRSAAFEKGAAAEDLHRAAELLGYPLFVKPVCSGSSFGVARVSAESQLDAAVEEAFRQDGRILLEEAVSGFEVGCAVLGNETLSFGAIDEIELAGNFFDYEEKYTLKTAKIHCPARISPEAAAQIRQTAETVYRTLGCRVFARIDFFLTPQGELLFNEVNTIPGFTAHSRYPSMLREAGIPFPVLLNRLIRLGVSQ